MAIVLLLLAAFVSAFAFFSEKDKLILTPYIEEGEILKARELAKVPPLMGTIESYSGFVTVNENCDSNLFFWHFPVQGINPEAPVIVWLQGGPGATSLWGLFTEIGPYNLSADYRLELHNYPWTRLANVVFIDSPVGTGFSYTGHTKCYATNSGMVATDLLSAVKQILQLFPEVASNPLFVVGESYAGKYVVALGWAIFQDRFAEDKINLEGLAIGNGIVDPLTQSDFSDYLYQHGLLNDVGKHEFKKFEAKCQNFVFHEMWTDAAFCLDRLITGKISPYPSLFTNLTGFDYYYNYLYAHQPPEADPGVYVTQSHIRKSIHVGDAIWNTDEMVKKHMLEDTMQSVRPWLEELVDNYRVLIYNGHLDIIVSYPMVVKYIKKMKWSGLEEYKTTPSVIWKVHEEIAGYAKTAGKLTEVVVRNAGHLVPTDQPEWAFDLFSRFLNDQSFN